MKDDRQKWDDVVPDSMAMDNSKSLYSNDELKTDDTRGEMSTDVLKKMISLNNPESKDDISVSDTSVSESEMKKERKNK